MPDYSLSIISVSPNRADAGIAVVGPVLNTSLTKIPSAGDTFAQFPGDVQGGTEFSSFKFTYFEPADPDRDGRPRGVYHYAPAKTDAQIATAALTLYGENYEYWPDIVESVTFDSTSNNPLYEYSSTTGNPDYNWVVKQARRQGGSILTLTKTEVFWSWKSLDLSAQLATSSSSVAIGTGSKSFTLSASGLFLGLACGVKLVDAASSANYMIGLVTAYSGTSLTVNVLLTGGSGTISSWKLYLHSFGPQPAPVYWDLITTRGSTVPALHPDIYVPGITTDLALFRFKTDGSGYDSLSGGSSGQYPKRLYKATNMPTWLDHAYHPEPVMEKGQYRYQRVTRYAPDLPTLQTE